MSRTPGRPKLYESDEDPMRAYSVRMTEIQRRIARRLGNGSLSTGIRRALEHAKGLK